MWWIVAGIAAWGLYAKSRADAAAQRAEDIGLVLDAQPGAVPTAKFIPLIPGGESPDGPAPGTGAQQFYASPRHPRMRARRGGAGRLSLGTGGPAGGAVEIEDIKFCYDEYLKKSVPCP